MQNENSLLSGDIAGGSSSKQEEKMAHWEELFSTINEPLHIVNAILERIQPDLAEQYEQLHEKIKQDQSREGFFLAFNDCHLPGLAAHFNMQPPDTAQGFHFDGDSLFLGYDWVLPYGDFSNCTLDFEDLGINIAVKPGDIIIIWGAALKHKVGVWDGTGRMVLVPFGDRRLFPAFHTARPRSASPLFGKEGHTTIRSMYPAQPLPSLT